MVALSKITCEGGTAYARLKHWHATHGTNFTLEWRGNAYPVKLYKYSGDWRLAYRQTKQYTQYTPFNLEIGPFRPNHMHIANIQRTSTFSGSTLVNFVLAIGKKLGCVEADLQDAAEVYCAANQGEMRLSTIQLLKQGQGFYERFGFKIENSRDQKRVTRLVANIQKVKLSTVMNHMRRAVALLETARGSPKTFTLRVVPGKGYPDQYVRNARSELPEMIESYKAILGKMERSTCATFADFLVQSAHHTTECAVYTKFMHLAFNDNVVGYRGKDYPINKWGRLVQELENAYPLTLTYTF